MGDVGMAQLLTLPAAVVALAGFAAAIAQRRRLGGAATGTLAVGCLLLAVAAAGWTAASVWVTDFRPERASAQMGLAGAVTLALAMILAGGFVGRRQPFRATQPAAPAPRPAQAPAPNSNHRDAAPAQGWTPPAQSQQSDWATMSGVWSLPRDTFRDEPRDR